jgi:hypothetical protein
MITIRKREFWLTEPEELVFDKLSLFTKRVNFGLFNAFKTDHANFNKAWIGEIRRQKKSFKLFRVTGKSSTSDLSVNGVYTTRFSKPLLVVHYKIHFTAIIGLFGILVTTYALLSLVGRKIVIDNWLLGIIIFSVGVIYSLSVVRDLNKTDNAMEQLLSKRINWSKENDKNEE